MVDTLIARAKGIATPRYPQGLGAVIWTPGPADGSTTHPSLLFLVEPPTHGQLLGANSALCVYSGLSLRTYGGFPMTASKDAVGFTSKKSATVMSGLVLAVM